MAFVTKETRRLVPDFEPEMWYEVRVPLSTGDLKGLTARQGELTLSIDLMTRVITGWNSDRPIDDENVNALDFDTYMWLSREILEASNVHDEAEKKDSAVDSKDISDLVVVGSRSSSSTSKR